MDSLIFYDRIIIIRVLEGNENGDLNEYLSIKKMTKITYGGQFIPFAD